MASRTTWLETVMEEPLLMESTIIGNSVGAISMQKIAIRRTFKFSMTRLISDTCRCPHDEATIYFIFEMCVIFEMVTKDFLFHDTRWHLIRTIEGFVKKINIGRKWGFLQLDSLDRETNWWLSCFPHKQRCWETRRRR